MNARLPLTLGTATLGMAYGVANPREIPTTDTAFAILDRAWETGVTCLDTAPAYGEAERRIGEWMRLRNAGPALVTKLPSLAGVSDGDAGAAIRKALEGSFRALGVTRVYGYLTHDATDYLRPAVRQALAALSHEGKIEGYGPSVYVADEVFAAIDAGSPDLIQLPVSALDQRMIVSGALEACEKAGVTMFARSVFLQGLLLMPPARISAKLADLVPAVDAFQELARKTEMNPQSLALRFVRGLSGVASAVVGVYSTQQLDELATAAAEPPLQPAIANALGSIAGQIPEPLLDPRHWP